MKSTSKVPTEFMSLVVLVAGENTQIHVETLFTMQCIYFRSCYPQKKNKYKIHIKYKLKQETLLFFNPSLAIITPRGTMRVLEKCGANSLCNLYLGHHAVTTGKVLNHTCNLSNGYWLSLTIKNLHNNYFTMLEWINY